VVRSDCTKALIVSVQSFSKAFCPILHLVRWLYGGLGMARELNRLTALQVKAAPTGMYGDGDGLWLVKTDQQNGKWILRLHVYGRRREMGLGTYPAVSLKDVRANADKWRRIAKSGQDPIKLREKERRDAEHYTHLLRDVALDAFESHKTSLKGDGKAGR
jgi:hypothetical protein